MKVITSASYNLVKEAQFQAFKNLFNKYKPNLILGAMAALGVAGMANLARDPRLFQYNTKEPGLMGLLMTDKQKNDIFGLANKNGITAEQVEAKIKEMK